MASYLTGLTNLVTPRCITGSACIGCAAAGLGFCAKECCKEQPSVSRNTQVVSNPGMLRDEERNSVTLCLVAHGSYLERDGGENDQKIINNASLTLSELLETGNVIQSDRDKQRIISSFNNEFRQYLNDRVRFGLTMPENFNTTLNYCCFDQYGHMDEETSLSEGTLEQMYLNVDSKKDAMTQFFDITDDLRWFYAEQPKHPPGEEKRHIKQIERSQPDAPIYWWTYKYDDNRKNRDIPDKYFQFHGAVTENEPDRSGIHVIDKRGPNNPIFDITLYQKKNKTVFKKMLDDKQNILTNPLKIDGIKMSRNVDEISMVKTKLGVILLRFINSIIERREGYVMQSHILLSTWLFDVDLYELDTTCSSSYRELIPKQLRSGNCLQGTVRSFNLPYIYKRFDRIENKKTIGGLKTKRNNRGKYKKHVFAKGYKKSKKSKKSHKGRKTLKSVVNR